MSLGLRTLSANEQEVFVAFFDRLTKIEISSILLRNYEEFPHKIGHDIDVFFRRADLRRALAVLLEVLREKKGEVTHFQQLDYVLCLWFRAGPEEANIVHLDFYHGAFTWHGLHYLSEEEVVAASIPFRLSRIPHPAHEALNLYLTSLLWGGFVKERYTERIDQLLLPPGNSAEFRRLFVRAFGKDCDPNWRSPDKPAVQVFAKQLRRRLKLRSFMRSPFLSTLHWSRYWARELALLLRPAGLHVVLLGPDGAGKSAVAEALIKEIAPLFGTISSYHWRPGVLPDIGVLFRRRSKQSGPVTSPHGSPTHSGLTSSVRLLYYLVDYWLGFPTRIQKSKAQNGLVLFDRYAADMWCDPKRYRLSGTESLTKIIFTMTPPPDLTYVLLASPEVLLARKAEVPPLALQASLEKYAEVARTFPGAKAIDCSRPLEQVVATITATMLEHLKRRALAALSRFTRCGNPKHSRVA
jgi:thymidylate kinase